VIEIEESMSDTEIYTQDIAWLQECETLIAEVSVPSLGVGYEIAWALNLNKPVLGIYEENRTVSVMITGNTSSNLTLRSYRTISEILLGIKEYLDSLSN
jgi:nucleoside 2-deoxyribosyltransferase